MHSSRVFFLIQIAVLGCHFSASAATAEPKAALIGGTKVGDTSVLDKRIRASVVRLEIIRRTRVGKLETVTCTGTVVGAQTVLTANHCLERSVSVIVFAADQSQFSASYAELRSDSDFAYLGFDKPLEGMVAVPFGQIDDVKLDSELLIVGWGRTSIPSKVADAGDDKTPSAPVPAPDDGKELRYTLRKVLMTEEASYLLDPRGDHGKLCYGDSGGGVFVQTPERLEIVGVNSAWVYGECRGLDQIQKLKAAPGDVESYLRYTSLPRI